jgi:hypothetical protein
VISRTGAVRRRPGSQMPSPLPKPSHEASSIRGCVPPWKRLMTPTASLTLCSCR